jgi:iron complex outermembrane recepter protein
MTKRLLKNILACSTITVCWLTNGFSQTDTAKLNVYENMSLKELLNIKIVSASKKLEQLFDAPVSASVITKETIRRTGCTSIMEALRLVPGLIVREQNNGNYDIHIRGMDNIPPNTAFDASTNTTTLVMINDRPVYNYLKGGTFWETLPVDINDVDRIEVIRGPASPLYGPNAVSGVIHIITRTPQKDGLHAIANVHYGSQNTFINNASFGYRWNKWSVIASGYFHSRDRSQSSYYSIYDNKWKESSQPVKDIYGNEVKDMVERYPEPDLAQKKHAGNIFLNYNPGPKKQFNIDAGITQSTVQRVTGENAVTPFSTSHFDDKHIGFRAKFMGLSAQFSYQAGIQDIMLIPGSKYDFHVADGNLEYTIGMGKLSVKPGISFRSATYDDTRYSDTARKTGIFNNKGATTGAAASLRSEYQFFNNKLRLISALRADKFNYPDTTYLSCQFAATYSSNKKYLFRITYSRAQRSPFIYDTYVDQELSYYPSGYRNFTKVVLKGNKNVRLLTSGMYEIGYRIKLTPDVDIDIELFDTKINNHRSLVRNTGHKEINGGDTVYIQPVISQNLPMALHHQGITASFIFYRKKLLLKSFITIQRSRMKNYSPYMNTADDVPSLNNDYDPAHNNIYSAMGETTKVRSTPTVFGGGNINYAFNSKLNWNLNAYYYSSQTFYHMSNMIFRDNIRGVDNIKRKLILNTKISYKLENNMHIFWSGKNILNDTSREFFGADETPIQLLGGINYEF